MSASLKRSTNTTPIGTWQRIFHRGKWERVSMGLIALGAVMLMQPVSLELFGYSFVVLLAGVIGYSIAGKLPGG